MKLSTGVSFKGFDLKKSKTNTKLQLVKILKEKNEIIKSLQKNYKNSYNTNFISKFKNYSEIGLFGMGGSSLGSRSIYNFLREKVKKKFIFFDNLNSNSQDTRIKKNDKLNIVISKSGNTLETIANISFFIKKGQKNIFITEKKNSYITNLAKKLKADVISHNNFIGGRYSVLSEVGMLPAELMGLDSLKFKQLNNLIKNKNFFNLITTNVSNMIFLGKKKKTNSIILNYDESSSDLFFWYQQLMAESLGKKNKGFLPIISNMPKDNHSLMQLYLDGIKNSFYTFFFVDDKFSKKINNKDMFGQYKHLKNKSMIDIKLAQFNATQNVFKKKNIPFRSFFISKRDEESLGVLFTFFMLETILLARIMKINPFDQPAVELIKNETNKIIRKT
tara:strand:+ start:2127 stop:3296 length:1170 start_codon:yes stop_codon:yes gene_type:complete